MSDYLKNLSKTGDFISSKAGAFKYEDLAILSTETGVEFTSLTIGNKSYLVRGGENGTTIPKVIYDLLITEKGTLDCHSHPYIGDLIPSEADKNVFNILTWQDGSIIIEPTQRIMVYNSNGAVSEFKASNE